MKDNNLICFDVDGVLISSMRIANEIIFDIIDEKLGLTTDVYRDDINVMAMSIKDMFDFLWREEIKEKGIVQDQLNEVVEEYRKRKMEAKIPVLPGGVDAMKLMADNFSNIAVVSSNSNNVIKETLKEMGTLNLVKKITGVDDVERAKPDPEMYALTCEYFNVDPGSALTFEDSTHGIHSAISAGMKVIAVTTGLESRRELEKTEASLILNGLHELTLDIVKDVLRI